MKEIFDATTYQIRIVGDALAKTWLKYNPLFDDNGNIKPNGRYWLLSLMDLSDAANSDITELKVVDHIKRIEYMRPISEILGTGVPPTPPVSEPKKEENAIQEEIQEVQEEQEREMPQNDIDTQDEEEETVGVPDSELTEVKGIGDKTAAVLLENGIKHLQDLADADATELSELLLSNGYKRAPKVEKWIQQAQTIIKNY